MDPPEKTKSGRDNRKVFFRSLESAEITAPRDVLLSCERLCADVQTCVSVTTTCRETLPSTVRLVESWTTCLWAVAVIVRNTSTWWKYFYNILSSIITEISSCSKAVLQEEMQTGGLSGDREQEWEETFVRWHYLSYLANKMHSSIFQFKCSF